MRGWITLLAVLAGGVWVSAESAAGRHATLFFTGYVQGNYGPCG